MAYIPDFLASGALTGSLATIYTCPTNRRVMIKSMAVANPTGGALNLVVELNPVTAGTNRQIIPARSIASAMTDLCAEVINQILQAGGIIQASGNGLVYYVSGLLMPASP